MRRKNDVSTLRYARSLSAFNYVHLALRKSFLSLFSTFPQADMYFIINEVCDKLANTINEHISDLLNDELVSNKLFEPRREKTGLRGFRPGPTQTGLYKLRKELEA